MSSPNISANDSKAEIQKLREEIKELEIKYLRYAIKSSEESSKHADIVIRFIGGLATIAALFGGIAAFFGIKNYLSFQGRLQKIEETSKEKLSEIETTSKRVKRMCATLCLLEGISNSNLKQWKEALASFDDAIELNPEEFAKAWYNKGIVYDNLENYKEAVKCYKKAIELKPDFIVDAYYGTGTALIRLKRYKEAIEYFNKVIEINPEDANVYFYKGVSLFELEKYKEAVKFLNTAIKYNLKNVKVYLYKGFALYQLSDYEGEIECYNKAIECYNKAIDLKEDYARVYYNRACMLASIYQEKKKALVDLEEAIKLNAEFKEEAKKDSDFDNIRKDPKFKRLVGLS